jgi:hypothetical protein
MKRLYLYYLFRNPLIVAVFLGGLAWVETGLWQAGLIAALVGLFLGWMIDFCTAFLSDVWRD